jgi:Reeler domain
MTFKLFVAIVALGIPIMVQGYSSGAPEEECETMTPRHKVDAQRGPAPYDIIFDKKSIRAGDTVTVTIRGRSNDDTIKGLLVQARVGDTPIGVFDVSPSRQYIKTLNCGNGRGVSQTSVDRISVRSKNQTIDKLFTFSVECLPSQMAFCCCFFCAHRSMTQWRDLFDYLLSLLHRMPSLTRNSLKAFQKSRSSGQRPRTSLNV